MAELIQRELQKFDRPEDTEIFFSAHGVPVSYVEQVHEAPTLDLGYCLLLNQAFTTSGSHPGQSSGTHEPCPSVLTMSGAGCIRGAQNPGDAGWRSLQR